MKRPTVTLVRGPGVSADVARPADELAAALTDDMTGQHVVISASSADALTHVLDAVLRGASLTLILEQPIPGEEAFLDELRRVADVREPDDPALDPITIALLEDLAGGASTEEAARRQHLSTRSAYRLLAGARAALGVSTNTEALLVVRSGPGSTATGR